MSKALFFDFDGVILDSVNIKTEAFRQMFLPFGNEIADLVVEHHIAHGGVSRFEKFKFYYNEFLKQSISEEKVNELADEFSSIVLEKVLNCPIIPGMIEFLEKNQFHFNCYVVSGTPEIELKNIADQRSLSKYFKGIYGSPRNKIQILNDIIYSGEIDLSKSYFLGDASTDLEAARHFGLNFVLVNSPDNTSLKKLTDLSIDNFLNFNLI